MCIENKFSSKMFSQRLICFKRYYINSWLVELTKDLFEDLLPLSFAYFLCFIANMFFSYFPYSLICCSLSALGIPVNE